MNANRQALHARIQDKTARLGIIGLGYVGLPLVRMFATGGYRVVGFDIDAAKVERLIRGESYIGHISAEVIGDLRRRGFEATTAFERLAEVEAIIICVPTPLTAARDPDLTYI